MRDWAGSELRGQSGGVGCGSWGGVVPSQIPERDEVGYDPWASSSDAGVSGSSSL